MTSITAAPFDNLIALSLKVGIVKWPDAEVDVDASLVERLRTTSAPRPDQRLRFDLVSTGFDNSIWRLGDDLVVRVPRRQIAVQLLENEQRWLPDLAPRLPLKVPTPLRIGRPSEFYPWPWTITRWIEGTPGNEVDSNVLSSAATPLGEFLRALHDDAPTDAPLNPFRGVPLRENELTVRTRIQELGGAVDPAEVLSVWEMAAQARRGAESGTPQWIHGDPHPANLIFDDVTLVGVIDFGDLCAGDPATDLAGGLLALPFDSVETFLDAYGGVDDALLRRTLGWAVHFGIMFLLLGRQTEESSCSGHVGQRALRQSAD